MYIVIKMIFITFGITIFVGNESMGKFTKHVLDEV